MSGLQTRERAVKEMEAPKIAKPARHKRRPSVPADRLRHTKRRLRSLQPRRRFNSQKAVEGTAPIGGRTSARLERVPQRRSSPQPDVPMSPPPSSPLLASPDASGVTQTTSPALPAPEGGAQQTPKESPAEEESVEGEEQQAEYAPLDTPPPIQSEHQKPISTLSTACTQSTKRLFAIKKDLSVVL